VERLATKYRSIVSNTISADITTAAPELEAFRRQDGTLVVPHRTLGDIGWRNLHKQMRQYIMGHRRDFPDSHYMLWQGNDRLWIYSPHANIVYLCNELCRKAPVVIPATLDEQLPRLMPHGAYLPSLDDELTMIELSDASKGSTARVPLEQFLARCGMSTGLREDFLPWFRHPSFVPIKLQAGALEAATIVRSHKRITGQIEHAIATMNAGARKKKAYVVIQASELLQ
jgi:hypothetical protein